MAARLFRADWVFPVDREPIPDGGVLVDDDGIIEAVAPCSSLPDPAGIETIDLDGCALMPGMVNVHAHPELSMFRGALEDLPFSDWINRLMRVKTRTLDRADHLTAARWTMVEALRAGMTTLAATEATGVAAQALAEAGVRGLVYQEVFGPDPRAAGSAVAGLVRQVERLRDECPDFVTVGVSPHAPYTVSDELYTRVAELAVSERLPVAVHIAESLAERMLVTEGAGDFAAGLRRRGIRTPSRARSPIALLERVGILATRPLLIHSVDVDDVDLRTIADSGSAVAHCPVANAKLGHGTAPLADMLDRGIRVGLGTDSVASNNRLDLFEEARFGALLQRSAARSADLLPAADLLELCTLGGARALGLDGQIGTLRAGKYADLCAVSLAGAHTRPVHDPVAAVFHSARASDVVLTAVQGRILYRNGRVDGLDEAEIGREMEAIALRMREP